jgi:hypothetical protein
VVFDIAKKGTKTMRTLAILLAIIAFGCGRESAAQEAFPTSANQSRSVWSHMVPSHFPEASPAMARDQCRRQANLDSGDALTLARCDLLYDMLQRGACRPVPVPDGVTFDFMSEPTSVLRHVTKRLGRMDTALQCDLGDGVIAHYFTGEPGRSCNNLGIMITARPLVCRQVQVETMSPGVPGFYQPGVFIDRPCNCDLNLQGMYDPGRPPSSTTSTLMRCE